MNKSTFVAILIVIIVVLGGGLFYFQAQDVEEEEIAPIKSSNVNPDEEALTEPDQAIMTSIVENDLTQTGKLEDISGGASSGVAYVLRDNDKLNHLVDASLPDLTGNNFYEGWLVRKNPSLIFFSTGKMSKLENGNFQLMYSSNNLYEGYNEVVITRETVDDKTPEEHILEGNVN